MTLNLQSLRDALYGYFKIELTLKSSPKLMTFRGSFGFSFGENNNSPFSFITWHKINISLQTAVVALHPLASDFEPFSGLKIKSILYNLYYQLQMSSTFNHYNNRTFTFVIVTDVKRLKFVNNYSSLNNFRHIYNIIWIWSIVLKSENI